MTKVLARTKALLAIVLVLAASAFALYTGGLGTFPAPLQRGLFLLLMMPLIFIFIGSGLLRSQVLEDTSSLAMAALSAVVFTRNVMNFERLYSDPFLEPTDIILGAIGLILVLEAVRRTVGLAITIIFILFLLFAYYGQSIPVSQLRHGGLDFETIVSMIFYGTDGVFGAAIGVCATFIIVIIMFGGMLGATGTSTLFMNLAKGIAGRFVGGPAKIAVVGSALMGMITGATVANVATTGSVTIPMMKRAGYDRQFAGAVEALASSGGQLMPPIMGAAAFVMIEYLNIDYFELIGYAIIPAILYFLAVLLIVHMRSLKLGLGAIPLKDLPDVKHELLTRGHMLIPIVILVVLMSQRPGIMYVAFIAVVSAMVLAQVRRETRLDLRGYYEAFESSMKAMAPLVAICAGAGILIGVLTATGLNLKITFLIEYVAQGSLFITLLMTMIACIVLGMGLPTVAAYVVLATLVPASMINLGVPPIAAHLFIFYFAILSAITPPVCTGAYVAAGIAGGDPLKTGIVSIKLGLVVFLLPYAFVYSPTLLMIGEPVPIALHVLTAVAGITAWAFGIEGFLTRNLNAFKRAAFFVSGVLLIWPAPLVSLIGFLIGAPLAAWEFFRGPRIGRSELKTITIAPPADDVSGSALPERDR
ncbi:MAG: TRAP transporter fused permease subunit [Gammaproteobacteria bacterium]|nr:TRAP transporter fused permease subunit [Gammaproteobacteria bacterium]